MAFAGFGSPGRELFETLGPAQTQFGRQIFPPLSRKGTSPVLLWSEIVDVARRADKSSVRGHRHRVQRPHKLRVGSLTQPYSACPSRQHIPHAQLISGRNDMQSIGVWKAWHCLKALARVWVAGWSQDNTLQVHAAGPARYHLCIICNRKQAITLVWSLCSAC